MPQKSTDNELDLNALVSKANRDVLDAADHARSRTATSRRTPAVGHWLKLAFAVGTLAILLVQAGEIRRQLFGVSQATLGAEAATILTAARAAVEEHHTLTGKWPDRVPLAALDALVTMHGDGIGYQLELELDEKSWQMDRYGTISGVEQ